MQDQTHWVDPLTGAISMLGLAIAIVLQAPALAGEILTPENKARSVELRELLAQAGSTGGSVGNEDKAVSGGQDSGAAHKARRPRPEPAARKHSSSEIETARPYRLRRETTAHKRQYREATESLAIYDGEWNGTSTGACIPDWHWKLRIANGAISGSGATGHVSRGGTMSGSMVVFSTTYDFIGHINSDYASGTWTTARGCSGKWTSTKS